MIRRFNPLYALLPVTLFLGACTTDSDESVTPVTDPDGGNTGFVATYKPDVALMPFPTDAWRSGSTDGTLNIYAGNPQFESDPLFSQVEQMNLLDGFGLNSPIWTDFSDPVDEETLVLGETVFVFRVAVAGTAVTPTPVGSFEIGTAGFQGGRSVLELNPTAPLDPLTTYAVIVTGGVQSTDGVNASADAAFQAMVDAFPAPDTASDSDTVEAIYDGMVSDLLLLAEGAGIGADNVVSAWTFTTQSISQSLDAVSAAATAQTSAIVPLENPAAPGTIFTAGELLLPASDLTGDGVPDIGLEANVFAGVIEMPYYLDPEEALTGYWEADADNANCQGAIAADAIAEAPASTTIHCPVPELQATISVPVLLTVPNAAMDPTCGTADSSGHVPVQGVTIFQHGITQNRTNLLAIAGTLAQTCHAGIAIDLPLHGITDTTSPLYGIASNDLYAALEAIVPDITAALTEQTFNLDVDGEEGIDPSGEYFINLESPITARDALRQAAANLVHLTRSIETIDFNIAFASALSDPAYVGPDFVGADIRFVGHSLGGITGATYLGVDATADAAVLVAPGGDIGDLILGSASIYPEVEAGLAENGLTPGMRFFDEFFRNAQTLVEAGDPVNYAAAANANHNILMTEVVGGAGNLPDQVVPNSATEKLASAMGLPTVVMTTADAGGVDGFVQFVAGDHSSLLSPTASAAATTEMQTQLAVFISGHPGLGVGPGGNAILISDPSVIAQ